MRVEIKIGEIKRSVKLTNKHIDKIMKGEKSG
jgi:hypothetical protein